MALSTEEVAILRETYHELSEFLVEEKRPLWSENENAIIDYCIENDLHLYNIRSLKLSDASDLLGRLLDLFLWTLEGVEKEVRIYWVQSVNEWQRSFDKALADNSELKNMFDEAYLSVGDQYIKTNDIAENTLLTFNDMRDLFSYTNQCEAVIAVEPFSLTNPTQTQEDILKDLLNEESNDARELFLPVTHDGHWFYLLKQQGQWILHDSQLLTDEGNLTPRQISMCKKSSEMLSGLTKKNVELVFQTTAQQDNDYDCGTRVINAYRSKVILDYFEKSHQEILDELFKLQVLNRIDKESQSSDFEEIVPVHQQTEQLSPQAQQIIETTASAQISAEKIQQYKQHLNELVTAVTQHGLLSHVVDKIDVDELDVVKANEHESDEDFAKRLQEAEFRKAGYTRDPSK